MNALGLEHKNSIHTCFSILKDISSLSKLKRLDLLHEAAGIVMDKLVFRGDGLSGMINDILTTHERDEILNRLELTDDGRFPCRFPGCPFSFKLDGRSRRKHELKKNELKLLGVTVNEDPCNWDVQFENMLSKASSRLYIIRVCKYYGFSLQELTLLFDSIIMSLFTYAIEVWVSANYILTSFVSELYVMATLVNTPP